MDASVYSALFGALSQEHRMGIIANNLANVATTGFKKDAVAFQDVLKPMVKDRLLDIRSDMETDPHFWPAPDLMAKVRLSGQRTNFDQGGLRFTGNPLDVAISGEGFFKVQKPSTGEIFLTRGGSFNLNAEGQIVDGSGNPVLSGGGPIQVPANTKSLSIDAAGNVRADNEQVGTLDISTVSDLGKLQRVGNNLYALPKDGSNQEVPIQAGQSQPTPVKAAGAAGGPGGETVDTIRTMINQGYVEASNVEVVSEMVAMIEVNRTFEAYQKIMSGSRELDQKLMAATQRA